MVLFRLQLPCIVAAIAIVKASSIKGIAPESKKKKLIQH
jgi:protein kinase C substrate 80K-H